MSLLNSISNAISSVPVSEKIQKGFLAASREGRSAIILPESAVIVGRTEAAAKRGGFLEARERLIEEISGAAVWLWGVEWMRNLFKKMIELADDPNATGFKKTLAGLMPKFLKGSHLGPEIAWNSFSKKLAHVDITAQERFTRNAAETISLLKKKSASWIFSVGAALSLAGFIVPKLNQLMTEWLIKKERGQSHPKPEPALPAPAVSSPISRPPVQPNTPWRPAPVPAPIAPGNGWPGAPLPPVPPPIYPTYPTPVAMPGYAYNRPPQFAGGLGALQALGHAIEQTPYGSILVVDAGLIAGRGYMASKRSIFESLEIIFRDAVSLYFYIKFAPQVFKAIAAGLDPLFKTGIQLEPKVVEALHTEMNTRLKKLAALDPGSDLARAMTDGKITLKAADAVLNGSSHPALQKAEGDLRLALRHANLAQFKGLLEKELGAYFGDPDTGRLLTEGIESHLKPQLRDGAKLGADELRNLLKDITEDRLENLVDAKGNKLGTAYINRTNLTTAIKQAFRHTAGLEVELGEAGIRKLAQFSEVLNALPKVEQEALIARIRKMAQQDGLDQLNSMFVRSLNIARALPGEATSPFIKRMEAQAGFIDTAVNRSLSLGDLARHELTDIKEMLSGRAVPDAVKAQLDRLELLSPAQLAEVEAALKSTTDRKVKAALQKLNTLNNLLGGQAAGRVDEALNRNLLGTIEEVAGKVLAGNQEDIKEVIRHYAPEMKAILENRKGRLFSLFVDADDSAVTQKLNELMKGGLKNDSAFIKEAQRIMGVLVEDSRKYASPAKAVEMRHTVGHYAEALMNKLKTTATKAEDGLLKVAEPEKLLEGFYKLNRNTHYLGKMISIGGAMIALGWLVPKLQYALTKKLTGKDAHPGIDSVEKAHGKQGASASPALATAPATVMPSQLKRTNFQAFNRAHAAR